MPLPSRAGVRRRRRLTRLAIAAGLLLTPSAANASAANVGSVYTETNATAANQVVAFNRHADGTLTEAGRFDTGGVGAPSPFRCGFPPILPPCSIVDSQGAVSMTPSGGLLFAVNTGSNTISSFRITAAGPKLVDQVSSGGDYPVSLDTHGQVLYVLNQASGSIAGFLFTSSGLLIPLPGSQRPLSTPGLSGRAEQIGFDKAGRTLTVTESGSDTIDTFNVIGGYAGPATPHPSSAPGPFGFAFDNLKHLLVSDVDRPPLFAGNVSTYSETGFGGLVARDNKPTGGSAPCWLVVTPDGRYAYAANFASKSISAFRIGSDGTLTPLGVTVSPNVAPGLAQNNSDEALSRDGRFLYALVTGLYGGDVGRVDTYRIGPSGALTFVASTPQTLPAGTSGLAAR